MFFNDFEDTVHEFTLQNTVMNFILPLIKLFFDDFNFEINH